ncbi:MAG: hypothetical protein IT427_04480 [Pirellulales bacterium]|nr:hypothetical protein [Pirellulales bacterium]
MTARYQTGYSNRAQRRTLLLILQCAVAAALTDVVARAQSSTNEAAFPEELVTWQPRAGNPVFTAEGPDHWDVKIRERGWILHSNDCYRLWFTGYDGKRDGIKLLGYATSADGLHWKRSARNPLVSNHWVEDLCVVEQNGVYYMFAEGQYDNHAEMLASPNGVDWKGHGTLEVRTADGKNSARKPCGTPTVWIENGTWYLFYEWLDRGVWLAKTHDPMSLVWTNVRDEPVLVPGPGEHDKDMIAVDQVIKYRGTYYAIYHGSGTGEKLPRTWNTDIARSADLVHWTKYAGNPIVGDNKSSGELVPIDGRLRLYTMHDQVDVFEAPATSSGR